MNTNTDRLERHLAHIGISSRREAKRLIQSGAVTVNGAVCTIPGFLITPSDTVHIDQKQIPRKETILVYKPRGIETTKTTPHNTDLHDILPQFRHLAPVGRLDKNSEGLILLTSDGLIARQITTEHSTIEKEYLVTVRETLTPEQLSTLASGSIVLDKKKVRKAPTKRVSAHQFIIILTEGRKHQIRRMCDAVHLTIEQLVRIRIGKYTIGTLSPGTWRQV